MLYFLLLLLLPFTHSISITNCLELQNINNNLIASYFLQNDIDCTNFSFIPIGGTSYIPFRGRLDGQYYTIYNLTIIQTIALPGLSNGGGTALFSAVTNGYISRLSLKNVKISSPYDYVASLIGTAINSNLSEVNVQGEIVCGYACGGLIAYAYGYNNLEKSWAIVKISSTTGGAGGLIGAIYSEKSLVTISNCWSMGSIQGGSYVGGLVGKIEGAIIQMSYSTANINCVSYCGGLVSKGSQLLGYINNSYATGNINGLSSFGGLTSYANGITNSYSIGLIQNQTATNVGGLTGVGLYSLTLTANSYWNIETSNRSVSGNGTGLSTSAMLQQSSYQNWDFENIWIMEEGKTYPTLRSLNSIIATCSQLQNLILSPLPQQNVFTLVSDIDCSTINNFIPIGTEEKPFRGVFRGSKYTIKNLNIIGRSYVGLFGVTQDSVITNFRIQNITIYGENRIGTLVGSASNSTFQDISIESGSITSNGTEYIGGLIGIISDSSSIDRTSVIEVAITAASGSYVGGLVGQSNLGVSISNSYSHSTVMGLNYVGGLIGGMMNGCKVKNTYSIGRVSTTQQPSGDLYVGGLIGSSSVSSVVNSYWNAISSEQTQSSGGIKKFTGDLYRQSTYIGWDFVNIWDMKEKSSYPSLHTLPLKQF